jgi:cbb3-type cytochrome c oxidase subunit II
VSRANHGTFGWKGACLVGITYVYFLIFAQFAFLKRLSEQGIADTHLKAVMAAMAAGGILSSLLAPRLSVLPSPDFRLRAGLALSAVAAGIAMLPLNFTGAASLAFLIGVGLGLLSVTLVTHLRRWTGDRNPFLAVGAGTGIGYFVCNFPPLFTAPAEFQALFASILCLAGIAITRMPATKALEAPEKQTQLPISFFRVLAGFTALVWLDSAAFFIIQTTPALKAGTWQGTVHLWSNGILHLGAALISAWWLQRKGLSPVLTGAFLALAVACLLLLNPDRALLASIFYPIGVSLYSVALVAYPSLIAPAASAAERGKLAGWIYAIAGWMGSALGIGMGQNLGHVPPAFVAAAGAVILLPQLPAILRRRVREFAVTLLVLLAAFLLNRFLHADGPLPQLTQVERGQQVYISEGCMSCHSQYVRHNSPDVLMWGPVETMQELHAQHPPLIGNRRQGPDLSQVGTRRSALWLKAHFYNPAQVSGSSIMPSYGFLFRDQRGDDLVAYLESLRGGRAADHQQEEQLWQPSAQAVAEADPAEGGRLYGRDCANCHSADGDTFLAWQSSFMRLPRNLETGPYNNLPLSDSPQQRARRIAQIAKFGIPGTDMPGHEYLSDREIASISLWLSQTIAQSSHQP